MQVLGTLLAYLGIVAFVLVLFAGALGAILGLPGTVLIVLDATVYSAFHGWQRPPWWLLIVLLGVSIFAEVSDNLISAIGVKRYGGSAKGMFWALVGSLVGAVLAGMAAAPLGLAGAVVGPIAGGLAGGFAGGYWYERRRGRSAEEARKAGIGAVLGRVAGTILKTVLAAVMVVVVLMNAF